VPDDNARPACAPARTCQRCGADLQAALHLPQRIGQPAYVIFRCADCGSVEWVPQGPEKQT
jgi:RNase P subunit RPR2